MVALTTNEVVIQCIIGISKKKLTGLKNMAIIARING